MRGSLSLGLQSSINTAMGLLFFFILARLITKEEMGIYATILFTSGMLSVAGALGLNVAAARFVPKLLAEGKGADASGVSKRILQVTALAAVGAGAIHYAMAPYFADFLTKSSANTELFRQMSLVAATTLTASSAEGLLMGLQEFGLLSAFRVVGQLVKIGISILLLLRGFGLLSVIAGLALYSMILTAIPLVFVKRRLGLGGPAARLGPLLSYSLPLFAANLLTFLSGWTDALAVMVYSVVERLGVYNVATTAASSLILIVLGSIQATLLPAMSRAYGGSGISGVERALTISTKYIMLFYCPMALGLAAAAAPAIYVFVGAIYLDASLPFALIVASTVAMAMATPLVLALSTLGRTGKVFVISASAVVVDLALSVVLVRQIGIEGAALGRASLFGSTLMVAFLVARKELKVKLPPEVVPILAASIVMLLPYEALTYYYNSLEFFPIYGLVSVATYGALVRRFKVLHRGDFEIFRDSLPRSMGSLISSLERFMVGQAKGGVRAIGVRS